ncbi:MAG: MvaI/BcnI restriction endonuclease family protein [Bacilli bacterium]|nr:MvaI/BcnI restriction endonuclease family protein [Bacilli bacterium]
MEKNMQELYNKFIELRNKGYVKSISKNRNSSGITLEYYLETTSGDICIPDFKNIEIKCISVYSKSKINMFSSSPDGCYILPTQYLADNYGYPDNDFKNINIFKGTIGIYLTKIGNFYFSIVVNNKSKRIYLKVYDKYKKFLNNDIYWDFDSIEEKLIRKMSNLAIITNYKMEKYGKIYYFYNSIKFYQLKSFNVFLLLIEKNIIKVRFNIGVYKSGYKLGKLHDHGTSFVISDKDLVKLFDIVY